MSNKQRFEFSEGGSSKFWEIWQSGSEVHTRYGRIGSDGQTTVKTEADAARAQKVYDKLVKEKTAKGYTLVSGATAAASPSPSPAASAATKAPARPRAEVMPWMAMGLGYRSADFDADDVYVISCRLNDDGDLAVQFDGTAGTGGFVCAAAAIERGSEKIHLAQGGAALSQDNGHVDERTPTPAFPPFLLSRSLFAALKAGESIAWPTVLTGDGTTVAVTRTGAGTRKITVNGKPQTVSTLEAKGADVRLSVLDDPQWPLILVDDEADECGWWLRAVGKNLDADAIADAGDAEEDDDADDDADDDDADDEEGAEGGWRRFEMEEKFWAISLDGENHTVKFGKIGTSGQEKTKSFDDPAAAKKDYEKLIREKTGKGYEEVGAED